MKPAFVKTLYPSLSLPLDPKEIQSVRKNQMALPHFGKPPLNPSDFESNTPAQQAARVLEMQGFLEDPKGGFFQIENAVSLSKTATEKQKQAWNFLHRVRTSPLHSWAKGRTPRREITQSFIDGMIERNPAWSTESRFLKGLSIFYESETCGSQISVGSQDAKAMGENCAILLKDIWDIGNAGGIEEKVLDVHIAKIFVWDILRFKGHLSRLIRNNHSDLSESQLRDVLASGISCLFHKSANGLFAKEEKIEAVERFTLKKAASEKIRPTPQLVPQEEPFLFSPELKTLFRLNQEMILAGVMTLEKENGSVKSLGEVWYAQYKQAGFPDLTHLTEEQIKKIAEALKSILSPCPTYSEKLRAAENFFERTFRVLSRF